MGAESEVQPQLQQQQQLPFGQLANKLYQIPFVNKTIDSLSQGYETYGRNSKSTFIRNTLGTVEQQLERAMNASKPYVEKHRETLLAADNIASQGLERVSGSVHQIEATLEATTSTLRQRVHVPSVPSVTGITASARSHIQSISDQATRQIESRFYQAATFADSTVDRFLPEEQTNATTETGATTTTTTATTSSDDTTSTSDSEVIAGVEAQEALEKLRFIPYKVGSRLFRRAVHSSENVLERLNKEGLVNAAHQLQDGFGHRVQTTRVLITDSFSEASNTVFGSFLALADRFIPETLKTRATEATTHARDYATHARENISHRVTPFVDEWRVRAQLTFDTILIQLQNFFPFLKSQTVNTCPTTAASDSTSSNSRQRIPSTPQRQSVSNSSDTHQHHNQTEDYNIADEENEGENEGEGEAGVDEADESYLLNPSSAHQSFSN